MFELKSYSEEIVRVLAIPTGCWLLGLSFLTWSFSQIEVKWNLPGDFNLIESELSYLFTC